MPEPRGHPLSDADAALLARIEAGEHTFRPSSASRSGEPIEALVNRLRSLRDRKLIRLADSRIIQNQEGRYLGAGPCDLTELGREMLERDRRLGPRTATPDQGSAPSSVLVVDDDNMMRTLVRRLLEEEGYLVHTAPGAEEAKFLLRKLSGEVDLLLTDIAMPGGMGTSLVADIRSSHPAVRVLYMSRYSREEVREHGIDPTGVLLLQKPFMPAQLIAAVRDALAQDSRSAGGPRA